MQADINQEILTTGLKQIGLELTEHQIKQLIQYTVELNKWNKTYNLTAVREPNEMIKRHILDSLSITYLVKEREHKILADIGTGAGIPGIILAIVFPEMKVFLIESIGKKCHFLKNVIRVLGIGKNVSVIQERVEKWQVETPIDLIICRAFTQLDKFVSLTSHLGGNKTTWLAMKALNTEQEETETSNDFKLEQKVIINVPFETVQRQVIILKKQ